MWSRSLPIRAIRKERRVEWFLFRPHAVKKPCTSRIALRLVVLVSLAFIGGAGCRTSIGYTRTGGVFRSNEHLWVNRYVYGTSFGAPEVQPEPVVHSNVYYVYGSAPAPTPRSKRDLIAEPTEPPAFDPHSARAALNDIDVTPCREAGAPRGFGHAKVVFNPDGRISKVIVDEPAGMSDEAARCIGDHLGTASVPAFKGSFIAMGTTFHVR